MTDETLATDEAQIITTPAEGEDTTASTPPATKISGEEQAKTLLAQRNAAKARADAAEAKLKEYEPLAQQVNELKASQEKAEQEKQKSEEKQKFFSDRPFAKELESQIDTIVAEQWFTLEEAFYLAAGKNKPELLLEEAVVNKTQGGTQMSWVAKDATATAKDPQTTEDLSRMTDQEVLQWQNNKAKMERLAQGQLR